MEIHREKYKYGSDADGNRGEWRYDITITSDISGDEIDQESAYIYDELICTYDELYSKIVTEGTANEELKCYWCDEPIEINEKYYKADDKIFHKDCLKEYLDDIYHVSDEWVINKYEYTYEDYLEDEADRRYHDG